MGGASHLPLSFCVSSRISSISGVTSKSLPPAEMLCLPSLLKLRSRWTFSASQPCVSASSESRSKAGHRHAYPLKDFFLGTA